MAPSRRKIFSRERSKSTPPCSTILHISPTRTMRFRPNNAPIVKTFSSPREGFLARDIRKRQRSLTANFQISCVGPMPAEEFVKVFFRPRRDLNGKGKERMPASKNAFRAVPVAPNDEKDMYGPLASPHFCYYRIIADVNLVRGIQWQTQMPYLSPHRYL